MRLDATAWLEHLDDARTLALAGDVEGVHQVRVSCRRLRVWLAFKGHPSLQEELRWLSGELALTRDLDVYGAVLTAEARADLRFQAVDATIEALDSDRWRALRDGLAKVKAPRRARAKKALPKLEAKLQQRRDALAPGDGDTLHALRRMVRQVRYAREWLGLDTAELAQEQEKLGAVCDLLAIERFARERQVEVPPALKEGIAQAFGLLESSR